MQRTDFIAVHSTGDIGEFGFIRSLLEANDILPFCPDQNAEAMSFWTSGFFRRFTVYVAPKDAERARELLVDYKTEQPEAPPNRMMQWVARALLVMFGMSLILGVLGHSR